MFGKESVGWESIWLDWEWVGFGWTIENITICLCREKPQFHIYFIFIHSIFNHSRVVANLAILVYEGRASTIVQKTIDNI